MKSDSKMNLLVFFGKKKENNERAKPWQNNHMLARSSKQSSLDLRKTFLQLKPN